MSRPPPTLPVSAKMYRHFATLTIAITLCLAMFAQGEGREALTGAIDKRQVRNRTLTAEAQMMGKRRLAAHELRLAPEGRAHFEFAQDPGEVAPAPIDDVSGSRSAADVTPGGPAMGTVPGTPPEAASYSGNPRLAGLPTGPGDPRIARLRQKPRGPTASELGKLLEASRSRAGATDGDDPGN